VSSQETTTDAHHEPVYQDLGDEMAMPSLDVDDRWHAFGKFIDQAAAQVDDFCEKQERLKHDVKAWQAKLAKAVEIEKKWRQDYKLWEADLLERFLAAKRQMQEP
jgi:hypothetical protein